MINTEEKKENSKNDNALMLMLKHMLLLGECGKLQDTEIKHWSQLLK